MGITLPSQPKKITLYGRDAIGDLQPVQLGKEYGVMVDEVQMKRLIREVLEDMPAHCPGCRCKIKQSSIPAPSPRPVPELDSSRPSRKS